MSESESAPPKELSAEVRAKLREHVHAAVPTIRMDVREALFSKIDDVQAKLPKRMLGRLRRRTLKTIRGAASYVVPSTVALSVTGFVVCVYHYHQRGVPVSALSSAQYVAAGVLYAALTGAPAMLGIATAAEKWWQRWGLNAVAAFGVASLPLGQGELAVPAALYFAILGAASSLMTTTAMSSSLSRASLESIADEMVDEAVDKKVGEDLGEKRSAKQKADSDGPPYAGVAWLWLLSTVAFSWFVFPDVPAWLGGGAPRQVELMWQTPPGADESDSLGSTSSKRCLFEVHSDSAYWYLLSMEPLVPGGCVRPQPFLLAPLRLDKRKQEYVVLPRSRVRLATYRRNGD